MSRTVVLHPVRISLKPYPSWERLRVAFECLVFGEVSFQGQITDVKSAPPTDVSLPTHPDKQPTEVHQK
jgi:hypothetical protein